MLLVSPRVLYVNKSVLYFLWPLLLTSENLLLVVIPWKCSERCVLPKLCNLPPIPESWMTQALFRVLNSKGMFGLADAFVVVMVAVVSGRLVVNSLKDVRM